MKSMLGISPGISVPGFKAWKIKVVIPGSWGQSKVGHQVPGGGGNIMITYLFHHYLPKAEIVFFAGYALQNVAIKVDDLLVGSILLLL